MAAYKDSSAHALRLRLYRGTVNRHDHTVFASGSVSRAGLRIEASVIGSSHVMEVRGRDLALTELLACEQLSRDGPVATWAPGDPGVEYLGIPNRRYRFEASVTDMRRSSEQIDALRFLIDRAREMPTQLGLSYRFPGGMNGSHAAETLVWAAATEGGVVARTAHSYPSESLVVQSLTTIELAEVAPVDADLGVLAAA